jgi:glutaconate CoA-transferase subunit B
MVHAVSGSFTDEEYMVLTAAAEIADGDVVFVGIGVPSLAAIVAKRTHAPKATLVYESGVVDALPDVPPLSTGSPSVITGAALAGGCLEVFGALQAGRLDVGILSAAQMDRNGNLNSTVIGAYAAPRLRMVGSGGAHDIASLIRRTVIVMPHDPRRFVERVDFVTSPGHDPGTDNGSPGVVITPRARFGFTDGEMVLTGVRSGLSGDDAVEGFGWTPRRAVDILELADPSGDAVEILRRLTRPR